MSQITKVTLNTVQRTLGDSKNTLSALCMSASINKWSARKPYAKTKYAPLDTSDIKGLFYGLQVPIALMNSITPATFSTTWQRLGPSSCFRLSDFNGYAHDAQSPFKGLSGVTNLTFKTDTAYTFALNLRTSQTSGSILVSDLTPHNTLYTLESTISDCYFGVALYRNNNASEWSGNKSTICQWAYCSSKTIGSNSVVSIPAVYFNDVPIPNGETSGRFYLVFFLTATAFTSFTYPPSSDSALTTKMAVLEGGIYPVKIFKEPEQFPTLWEGNDSDYYTTGEYGVSVTNSHLETPNEIDSFTDATVTIQKLGGRLSLNPTTDMENLTYYNNENITERRLRFSIFDIEGWIGNYIPKFSENDLANNCEFYPIIQYYDVDGEPVYIGIVYEYKGSSTLSVTTYTWERYIAFFDGSSFYGTTQIDTISYSVDESGHTKETSITPITKVLIQQNMNTTNGDWTSIQIEVYQGSAVTETAINNSIATIPTDVYNGAVTFGIDTQYSLWYAGSKAYSPITNRTGQFNLQLRIQDRL